MFRKLLDEARAGDNIGALLRGINRDEVLRGQVLAKPGSVHPHHKFRASVYVLTDVTGVIELPEGVEMVMPGDNVEMTVDLIHPIAVEKGTRFSIREGGRTVGAGNVSEIIE